MISFSHNLCVCLFAYIVVFGDGTEREARLSYTRQQLLCGCSINKTSERRSDSLAGVTRKRMVFLFLDHGHTL